MGRKLRFEGYLFDVDSSELHSEQGTLQLPEKPAQLLLALLEHAGQVVSREKLRHRLWSDDTFVDFGNNLHAAVKKLRDHLGDSAGNPHFIETIPRKGYRFMLAVEEMVEQPTTTMLPAQKKKPIFWLLPVLMLPLLTIAIFQWVLPRDKRASLPPGRIMLAVLPFENYSGDADQDYVCDGLTEELIAHLGRLQPAKLGVISRISAMTFKDSQQSAQEIGVALGVDYLLEGSVRKDGEIFRVTVQLIQVSDQTHLWAENYDLSLDDLLGLQNQVASKVARTMAIQLLEGGTAVMARAQLSDTQAYRAYLRGRQEWFGFYKEAYGRAIGFFEEALIRAPKAAIVHAGLADAYNLLAFADSQMQVLLFEKAEESARRALALDPDCAEAHNSLAFALLYHRRDYRLADFHFRRATDLNPGYAMAWHWYAGLLSITQRHDEAIRAMLRSLELDPLSLSLKSDLGWYYLFADRYEEGVNVCLETLELQPDYGWAISGLATGYAQLGLWPQAVFYARKSMERKNNLSLASPQPLSPHQVWLDLVQQRILQAEEKQARGEPWFAVDLAMDLIAAGQFSRALDTLETVKQDTWLTFLLVDPRFDPLHEEPRFQALVKEIGLVPH